jgi:hypothetical protein
MTIEETIKTTICEEKEDQKLLEGAMNIIVGGTDSSEAWQLKVLQDRELISGLLASKSFVPSISFWQLWQNLCKHPGNVFL